jgi:(p)ppGpp synthase/HD superfamily hydrolase
MSDLTKLIKLAEEVATLSHNGQTRRGGDPYITHPARIAARVDDRLKPIAWLHDVVEDTTITIANLRTMGFPDYVVDAVNVLTHRKSDTNEVYWNRILTNKDAVAVKLEDIRDNLASNPSEYARQKYTKALALFKQFGYSINENSN